jgi:uncharacterized protein with ParB-like and HNH nuclease domain
MDARSKTVKQVLHSTDQYLVPFFQRSYSWEKKNWKRLTLDVMALLEEPQRPQHFLGPLVCTPGNHVPGEVNSYQLIDGQQRLTTLSLLLAAFRDVCLDRQYRDLTEEAEEDYLVHKRRPGLQRYKVVPRLGDREVFTRLIDRKEPEGKSSSSVLDAYHFFHQWIEKTVTVEAGLDAMAKLLTALVDRLSLVVITITGENPYEIFESLNSTGLPLEESDLIRNYLFMQVPLDQQEEFNEEHWEPFESVLRAKVGDRPLDPTSFYRDYLMRTGRYSRKKSTFLDFKEQSRARKVSPADLAKELRRYLGHARVIEQFDQSGLPTLNLALRQLLDLDVSTANPLVMHLLDRQANGGLTEAELLGCLADLASFVLRRSICGLSTRGYDQWFVKAITEIKVDPRHDLQQYYLTRGWPSDKDFVAALLKFGLYNRERKKARLMLERLEDSYGHKERVDKSVLTVEHILPQKPGPASEAEWKAAVGSGGDWYAAHQEWVHTLGNLTLTGYNLELSNRPFAEKQSALLGSNLVLNRHFEGLKFWGPTEIEARGRRLAAEVAALWPNPALPPDADTVKARRTRGPEFDIAGLREASMERLVRYFGRTFKPEGEARFTADGDAFRLVCLASRPHLERQRTYYWYGLTPDQLNFIRRAPESHLAFCCGSPDRIVLFTLKDFEPLTAHMSATNQGADEGGPDNLPDGIEHPGPEYWHVKLHWADTIELDQPKKGEKLDVTARVLGSGS